MRDGARRCLSAGLLAAAAAALAFAGATMNVTSGTIGTNTAFGSFGFDPGTKFPKVQLVPAAGGKPVPMKVFAATPDRIDAQVQKGLAGAYTVLITPKDRAAAPVTVDGTFTILLPEPATITPATGPTNLAAVIEGDLFGSAKGRVTIGGKNAKVTDWATDRIEVVVPKKLAAGVHPVVVLGKAGTSTAALTYTVADGGGGDDVFFHVTVGSVQIDATKHDLFFTGTYNVSQDFAGAGVSKPPAGVPSFGFAIDHPAFATAMPYDVTVLPTATGNLTCTYADGAGSIYQAGADAKLTVTGYADGFLAGSLTGSLLKVFGPGAATVQVTSARFRAFLTVTGQ